MRTNTFFHRNGLSVVLFGIFLVFWTCQALTGWHVDNAMRLEHGAPALALGAYLHSGHFVSATFENWESEFLQMGMYVLLTVWLRQKGSSESRPLDKDDDDRPLEPGRTPWPLRRGGAWKWLYANSLFIAFALLFLTSFLLHLDGSWHSELDDRILKGQPPITLGEYASGAEFWFESFQNWQSEFLAVLSIVVLSIFLRQANSPESKPLGAPDSQTGC